jgi:hypothetical protein
MAEIDIWSGGGSEVALVKDAEPEILDGLPVRTQTPTRGVSLKFRIPGLGSKTRVIAHIHAACFEELAAAMLKSAPLQAEQAFLAALLASSLSEREKAPR